MTVFFKFQDQRFASWVPKMFAEEHKTKRLAPSFLEGYDTDGDGFFTHIVTGYETLSAYYTK